MLYFDFLQKIFSSKLYTVRKIIGWKTVQNVSLIYSREAVGMAKWQKNVRLKWLKLDVKKHILYVKK